MVINRTEDLEFSEDHIYLNEYVNVWKMRKCKDWPSRSCFLGYCIWGAETESEETVSTQMNLHDQIANPNPSPYNYFNIQQWLQKEWI